MTNLIDDIDRTILDLLQRDARMTNAAIGAVVGLSAPSVFERIRKMEQRGVIRGYTVRIDPAALGKTMTAFIRLMVTADEKYDPGLKAISQDPDVLECYNVAGEDCIILKTKVSSPEALQTLLNRVRRQVTVLRSVTMIALSALKEDEPISVAAAEPAPSPRAAKPLPAAARSPVLKTNSARSG